MSKTSRLPLAIGVEITVLDLMTNFQAVETGESKRYLPKTREDPLIEA